jgi:hypothetical protein
MHNRETAAANRTKAAELNEAWRVGAAHARYSYDGHWYATLNRFPAALFDPHGYILITSEEDYRAAPIQIGKQISVPKPGISGLRGYVRMIHVPMAVTPALDDISAAEGRELLRWHRTRERKAGLVARKKKSVLWERGRLLCEACDFDFVAVYGSRGKGFAECHHTLPISQSAPDRRTRLSELAIVCANCHRMLHRRPWLSVTELRMLVQSRRGEHS